MPYALGPVKNHVRAAAEAIGTKFDIKTVLGVGLRANESDHPLGLALDFMTTNGQPLADFVRANASAYGVKYVIWNQHIWSVERNAEGWRLMKDRGSATANHKDHVHVSFNSKAGTGAPVDSASNSGGTSGVPGCVLLLIAASGTVTGIVYAINRMMGA